MFFQIKLAACLGKENITVEASVIQIKSALENQRVPGLRGCNCLIPNARGGTGKCWPVMLCWGFDVKGLQK